MIKKIITITGLMILLVIGNVKQSNGQIKEIYDALVDAETSVILEVINLLDEKRNMIMEYVEELEEEYEWLEMLETVEQIDELLDLTVCSEESFYIYGALRNDMACFEAIEFEITLFDYDASLDFLYLALSSLSMEQGDRIRTLEDAIKYVKEMQEQMNDVNREVQNIFEAQMMEEAINSQSGTGYTINRY